MKNRVEAAARVLAYNSYVFLFSPSESTNKDVIEALVDQTWERYVPQARSLVGLIEASPPESLPLPDGQRQYLRDMAVVLKSKLPDNYGFIVLALPLGEAGGEDRVTYLSTLERPSAIAALKEWLLKCGSAEDWMKHIT